MNVVFALLKMLPFFWAVVKSVRLAAPAGFRGKKNGKAGAGFAKKNFYTGAEFLFRACRIIQRALFWEGL